jgi:hypothetical protein
MPFVNENASTLEDLAPGLVSGEDVRLAASAAVQAIATAKQESSFKAAWEEGRGVKPEHREAIR